MSEPARNPDAIRSRTEELRLYLDTNQNAPDRPIRAMDIAKIKFGEGNFAYARGWAEKVTGKVAGDPSLPEKDNYYRRATTDAHLLLGALEVTTELANNPPDFTNMYTHLAQADTLMPNQRGTRLFTKIPVDELERLQQENYVITGEQAYDQRLLGLAIDYRKRIQIDPTLFLASLQGDVSPFPAENRGQAASTIETFLTNEAPQLDLDPAQATELAANLLLWKQRIQNTKFYPLPDDDLADRLRREYRWATMSDSKFLHMAPDDPEIDRIATERVTGMYYFLQQNFDSNFTDSSLLSDSSKIRQFVSLYNVIDKLPVRQSHPNTIDQTTQDHAFVSSATRLLGMTPEHAELLIHEISAWRERDRSYDTLDDRIRTDITQQFINLNNKTEGLSRDEQVFIDDITRFVSRHQQDRYGFTDQDTYYRGLIEGFESAFYQRDFVPLRQASLDRQRRQQQQPEPRPQDRQAEVMTAVAEEPISIDRPGNLAATRIEKGRLVYDDFDTGRRKKLQRAFKIHDRDSFPPHEVYTVIENANQTAEGVKFVHFTVGGNFANINGATPQFYSFEATMNSEDAGLVLGHLFLGKSDATSILESVLHHPEIPAEQHLVIPEDFAINTSTNPERHIWASGFYPFGRRFGLNLNPGNTADNVRLGTLAWIAEQRQPQSRRTPDIAVPVSSVDSTAEVENGTEDDQPRGKKSRVKTRRRDREPARPKNQKPERVPKRDRIKRNERGLLTFWTGDGEDTMSGAEGVDPIRETRGDKERATAAAEKAAAAQAADDRQPVGV